MNKIRVFFDMDGVLAKWHPDATEADLYREGYFRHLEPTPYVDMAKTLSEDPEIELFTLSNILIESHFAYYEKWDWLERELPEVPPHHRLFVPCFTAKGDGVIGGLRPSDVLVDDHTPNLLSWAERGSLGIKAHNEVNNRHGRWKGLHIKPTDDPAEVARLIKAAAK